MKTNKAYKKRIRVTKNGKLIARAKGQNHFNAKASGAKRRGKRAQVSLSLPKDIRQRYLSLG
ncbi:MAG TPA: 50S ribosomal protein L35 [Candidatus Paceibacterota bacterium]|nr:50S ribosomal protein L35 [Candidatus Paceibacterota bacterium]